MNEEDFTIRLGTGSFFFATVSCWRVFSGEEFVDVALRKTINRK